MNLDTAAESMNAQSDIKAAEIEEAFYHGYHQNKKHWSNHPTSPHETTIAKGIISKKGYRSQFYIGKQISSNEFQVMYSEIFDKVYEFDEIASKNNDNVILAKIPLFRHVSTVTVYKDGIMRCTCCEY